MMDPMPHRHLSFKLDIAKHGQGLDTSKSNDNVFEV